ncbi:MAG: hypothetical protein V4558_13320 [Gemmatimonadota bacterium]
MAVAGLCVGLIGFSTTLFIPLARGTFHAPPIVEIHGALFFSWLLLLVCQAQLVRTRRLPTHRRLGWVGAGLAVAMAASGVAVDILVTHRDLAAGQGDLARGQFLNILIEMVIFLGLVVAAVLCRRKPGWHKRLILLATISVLGPAWLRFRHFLPWVGNPFVTFSLIADAALLVAIGHDLRTTRKVHPAYLWAGSAMFAIHCAELFLSDTGPWLATARLLLGEG